MPTTLPLDVESLRAAEFPALAGAIYLNAAAVAPLPTRARRVMESFSEMRARIHRLEDSVLVQAQARARALAARMVGARVEDIALGGNTSFGINVAALSLPLPAQPTVVVSDREFPANVYPWMGIPGARVELVPTDPHGRPDEDRLLERLDRGDVALFALSSVQFATGYRADLERFGRVCREHGTFFVVDAIQSLGQIPLDVGQAEIDVLAVGGHKWLCGPFGTGFAYVREELRARMEPEVVGWAAMRGCGDLESLLDYQWEPRDDARRFEVGTLPTPDLAGLAASMELLLEVGVSRIEAHLAEVLAPLHAWLERREEVTVVSDLSPGRRSAVTCFRPPESHRVFHALKAAGVVCAVREGVIRMSPHLYNTPAEMERVVEMLEQSRSRGWS